MNEEELRKLMQSGFEKLRPHIEGMTVSIVIEHHPTLPTEEAEMYIAWLEKQCEQKSVKVPKFKVGDFIQFNGMGHTRYTVKEVCGLSHYINTCNKRMDMSYTDANFELVEQKPANKIDPKFKVGDWVVYCNDDVDLITGIEENGYCINNGGYIPFVCASDIRLWTIQDAKAGDVLADGNLPFIFKKIDTNKYSYAYCGISVDDGFKIESDGESGEWTWMQDIKPATKEQRDLLFQKMKEAGYEWDAEKKELKKIEQKSVEWSEEDEERIKNILSVLDVQVCWDGATGKKGNPYQKEINWLKSLRPQSHWKPSEEMLEALYRVIPKNTKAISEDEMLLDKLYQGLKYGRVLSEK